MNTRRFLTTLTLTLILTVSVLAVPAKRDYRTFTQPDGSQVTLQLVGDERTHFYLTTDGKVVVADGDGYFFATTDAQGRPAPSTFRASDPNQRTLQQTAFLGSQDDNTVRQAFINRSQGSRLMSPAKAHEGLFPEVRAVHIGSPHFIIILVEYKDTKFKTTGYDVDAKEYFTNMLREEGFSEYNGTGSAYDFFNQNSMGQFTPQFDVYGPITLSKNRSYYGGNDWWGNDQHPEEMVIEACQQLDDEVDFSQYDTDGDGVVDNVFVFYAGQGEASYGSADTVWPHAWEISSAGQSLTCDGVQIDGYGCTNEWENGEPDGVGTFVHEFSHVLGLPDLYTTDYGSAGSLTPGAYSCMDYGPYNNDGRTPPCYSIYERNAMGWIEPEELQEGAGASYQIAHIFDSNEGFIINSPNPPSESTAEFFLIENRQNESWDTYIPGHGMMIWHIDYVPSVWEGNKPNNTSHQHVDIEEACGSANNNNYSLMAAYPFPGTNNVTSFNGFKTWRGTQLNYPITNIVESDGIISFDVCGGGVLVGKPTVNFESGTYYNPFDLVLTAAEDGDALKYQITDAKGHASDETAYTSPVRIDNACSVKVWSEREGSKSGIVKLNYEFKTGKPMISPESQTVVEMPLITITSETEDATIYYKVNSAFDTNFDFDINNATERGWQIYTEPFTLEERSTNLRAIAYYEDWGISEMSDLVSYKYVKPHSGEVRYNLYHVWEQEDQYGWNNSFSIHKLNSNEAYITMTACQMTHTITDYPVTNGKDITIMMNDGYTPIKGVYLKAMPWQDVEQTITLEYSKDGVHYYNVPNAKSDDFTLLCNEIPDGATSIRFKFSQSSKRVGLQEIRVSYGIEGEPLVNEEDPTVGISNINVDFDTDVEYYNMQGIRVLNPSHGYYIRRQGSSVNKVYIK